MSVRVLTNFSIYEENTRRLIPIAELLGVNHNSSFSYTASGFVRAWIDDNDVMEEDDETGIELKDDCNQRIKLSRIKKFTLHDMKGSEELDRHGVLSLLPLCADSCLANFTFFLTTHGIS